MPSLGPLGPRLPHRVVVPAVDRLPRVAAVLAAEQALRRAARVPDAGLVGVARASARTPRCRRALERGRRPRTRAAASPRSTSRRGRSSGTRSGRGGRCAPPSSSVRRSRGSSTTCCDDVAEEHRPRRPTTSCASRRRARIHAPLRVPDEQARGVSHCVASSGGQIATSRASDSRGSGYSSLSRARACHATSSGVTHLTVCRPVGVPSSGGV